MNRVLRWGSLLLLFAIIFGAWPHPRGLYAQSGHSVKLTWVAPTTGDAPTTYNIKRGAASGTEMQIASVPATALTYTDTAVVAGGTYFYEVTAANTSGESGPSNEVSATVPLAKPGAPGSLAATSN